MQAQNGTCTHAQPTPRSHLLYGNLPVVATRATAASLPSTRSPACLPACRPACLQINPITVVGLLEVAAVQPGQHLLITAAGSTLGRMLIRAARAEGIKTIGVVRRPEAVQELKESTGCDAAFILPQLCANRIIECLWFVDCGLAACNLTGSICMQQRLGRPGSTCSCLCPMFIGLFPAAHP